MTSGIFRRLYGNTLLSFSIRLAGVFSLLIANVVLARSIEQSQYGLYAYIVEIIALGAVVSALGFDQIAIRVVPDFRTDGNSAGFRLFAVFGLGLIGATAASAGLLLEIAEAAGAMPVGFSSPLVLLVVLALAALAALRLAQESLRASRQIFLSQVVEQLGWPVLLLTLGGAALAWGLHLSISMILTGQVALYSVGAGVLFFRADRLIETNSSGSVAANGAAGEWLGLGVPLALAATLSVFLNRGDILALGTLTTGQEVAPYAAASRYAALTILGLAAAAAASAGMMRDFWRAGDIEGLQHAVDRTTGIATLFALPLSAAYVFAPQHLLSVFGPGFTAGADALRILAIAQLINAGTGPVALLVIVCDMGRTYTAMMAGAALIMVTMLAMLVPQYGALGAATSTFCVIALLNVSLAIVIKRRLGIRSWATPKALEMTSRDVLHGARELSHRLMPNSKGRA